MEIPQTLEAVITDIIREFDPEVYIVELALHQGGKSVLSILVDTDSGISIDQCAGISRRLSRYFDEHEEVLDFPFRLEVSSPGLDRPLSHPRQYRRNVGRALNVVTTDERRLRGLLKDADDEGILLLLQPKKKNKKNPRPVPTEGELRLDYSDIHQAKVEISFS